MKYTANSLRSKVIFIVTGLILAALIIYAGISYFISQREKPVVHVSKTVIATQVTPTVSPNCPSYTSLLTKEDTNYTAMQTLVGTIQLLTVKDISATEKVDLVNKILTLQGNELTDYNALATIASSLHCTFTPTQLTVQ